MLVLVALGYLETPWDGGGGGERGQSTFKAGTRVTAEVMRVVDGDTAVVKVDGREERLRYIGVDTPESVRPDHPVECFGEQSSRRNAQLVEGRKVELELDRDLRDRYGRLLAYVRVGDLMVNAELLRDGYAKAITIAPNDRYSGRFRQLEASARQSGAGLWGQCP